MIFIRIVMVLALCLSVALTTFFAVITFELYVTRYDNLTEARLILISIPAGCSVLYGAMLVWSGHPAKTTNEEVRCV